MTHHIYWVWVEVYSDHFYAEKFHLKEHKDSPRKYKLLTGLNEVRPVVNTCIAVLREIAENDPLSSFGFIGANSEGESTVETKRFRVCLIISRNTGTPSWRGRCPALAP